MLGGGEMTATIVSESFEKLPLLQAKKLNRVVYCHHCQMMDEMSVLGIDSSGRVVYRCRRHLAVGGPCGGVVRLFWVQPS